MNIIKENKNEEFKSKEINLNELKYKDKYIENKIEEHNINI